MEQLRVRLISIVLLCCISSASYAQFIGGLVGGFTTSQVDGDEHSGFHRIGAYGGAFVTRYKDNCPWTHTFELAFAQKGAASSDHSFKTTIGYVDANYTIQAYPHFWIPTIFPHQLSIGLGPTLSVKAYENILLNDINITCNDFNQIDIQLNANLKYRLPLRTNKQLIDLEARTSYSIIPNSDRYYNFTLYFLLKYYISH